MSVSHGVRGQRTATQIKVNKRKGVMGNQYRGFKEKIKRKTDRQGREKERERVREGNHHMICHCCATAAHDGASKHWGLIRFKMSWWRL